MANDRVKTERWQDHFLVLVACAYGQPRATTLHTHYGNLSLLTCPSRRFFNYSPSTTLNLLCLHTPPQPVPEQYSARKPHPGAVPKTAPSGPAAGILFACVAPRLGRLEHKPPLQKGQDGSPIECQRPRQRFRGANKKKEAQKTQKKK